MIQNLNPIQIKKINYSSKKEENESSLQNSSFFLNNQYDSNASSSDFIEKSQKEEIFASSNTISQKHSYFSPNIQLPPEWAFLKTSKGKTVCIDLLTQCIIPPEMLKKEENKQNNQKLKMNNKSIKKHITSEKDIYSDSSPSKIKENEYSNTFDMLDFKSKQQNTNLLKMNQGLMDKTISDFTDSSKNLENNFQNDQKNSYNDCYSIPHLNSLTSNSKLYETSNNLTPKIKNMNNFNFLKSKNIDEIMNDIENSVQQKPILQTLLQKITILENECQNMKRLLEKSFDKKKDKKQINNQLFQKFNEEKLSSNLSKFRKIDMLLEENYDYNNNEAKIRFNSDPNFNAIFISDPKFKKDFIKTTYNSLEIPVNKKVINNYKQKIEPENNDLSGFSIDEYDHFESNQHNFQNSSKKVQKKQKFDDFDYYHQTLSKNDSDYLKNERIKQSSAKNSQTQNRSNVEKPLKTARLVKINILKHNQSVPRSYFVPTGFNQEPKIQKNDMFKIDKVKSFDRNIVNMKKYHEDFKYESNQNEKDSFFTEYGIQKWQSHRKKNEYLITNESNQFEKTKPINYSKNQKSVPKLKETHNLFQNSNSKLKECKNSSFSRERDSFVTVDKKIDIQGSYEKNNIMGFSKTPQKSKYFREMKSQIDKVSMMLKFQKIRK